MLLEPKYLGGGLANIWGGLCPPGPNVEPPLGLGGLGHGAVPSSLYQM